MPVHDFQITRCISLAPSSASFSSSSSSCFSPFLHSFRLLILNFSPLSSQTLAPLPLTIPNPHHLQQNPAAQGKLHAKERNNQTQLQCSQCSPQLLQSESEHMLRGHVWIIPSKAFLHWPGDEGLRPIPDRLWKSSVAKPRISAGSKQPGQLACATPLGCRRLRLVGAGDSSRAHLGMFPSLI